MKHFKLETLQAAVWIQTAIGFFTAPHVAQRSESLSSTSDTFISKSKWTVLAFSGEEIHIDVCKEGTSPPGLHLHVWCHSVWCFSLFVASHRCIICYWMKWMNSIFTILYKYSDWMIITLLSWELKIDIRQKDSFLSNPSLDERRCWLK